MQSKENIIKHATIHFPQPLLADVFKDYMFTYQKEIIILTLKVTHNDLQFRTCYSAPTYYILKTGIIINKICTRKLFTATRMYSNSWRDVEKNCLIFKPQSRKARRIVMWATQWPFINILTKPYRDQIQFPINKFF